MKPIDLKKYLLLAVIAFTVIGLDQWTKTLILRGFRLSETVPVIDGFFSITYVQNTGAAFGLLANADPSFRIPFFLIVPIVAFAAILGAIRKIPSGRPFWHRDTRSLIALSLIAGGAVGNLIDRMTLNFVVDFLSFHWRDRYHFDVFNIADSAICVGVGLMLVDLLSSTRNPVKTEAIQ